VLLALARKQRLDALKWYLGLHIGGKAAVGLLQLVDDGVRVPEPDFKNSRRAS